MAVGGAASAKMAGCVTILLLFVTTSVTIDVTMNNNTQ
jgi:hypothetical protein